MKVVGCFIEWNGKFVILHRRVDKSQGDKWGLVAGKVNRNESNVEAILREIEEETGYHATEKELEFLGEYVWDFPEYTLTFPTFRLKLKQPIQIKYQPNEHAGYKWVTAEECYSMKNLVHGFHDLLGYVGYIKKKY